MSRYTKQISKLYELCTALRQNFIAIDRQVEKVQEISLNASVSAGHLGARATACSEIAHQVNATSKRMRHHINAMRGEVNAITSRVLSMLIQTSRHEKYEMASQSVRGSGNRQLVFAILDEHMLRIGDMASNVQENFYRASAILRLFSRCYQRLFIALSALEIEAVGLESTQSQIIMTLVERLGEVVDDGTEQVEQARKTLLRIKKYAVFVQDTTNKETICAKVRSA